MSYRIEIIPAEHDLHDFLALADRVYENDPLWVAPMATEVRRVLEDRENPYFVHASLRKFICYRNGQPVARSIAVINREHWIKSGRKEAFFGFFESLNDQEGVSRLFENVSRYCRDEGAECLAGPFNPNHYSELGMLTENFHSAPAFFETYNPAYYPGLLEANGFQVIKKLHTRINTDAGNYLRQRYPDVSFPAGRGDYRVRCLRILDVKADLERIREVNNDAFSDNWHFLPLSKAEYKYSAKSLFFVTKPDLIVLIEKFREPVGVIQFMLNINPVLQSLHGHAGYADYLRFLWKRRSVNSIVLYSAGVKKAFQNTPVAWLMMKATCAIAQRYPVLSTTWMSDDNLPSVKTSEHLGLVPYKWFSVYEKSISNQ